MEVSGKNWRVLIGDCRKSLASLPPNSVHCAANSPPYYGLRDYGTGTWVGGDTECDHRSPTMRDGRSEDRPMLAGSAATNSAQLLLAARSVCGKCGATRVDEQIGLEESPEEYIDAQVEVFREVRRVLHPTGVLWLNLGDSYATSVTSGRSSRPHLTGSNDLNPEQRISAAACGVKAKDILGIPFRVAFALQADGWYLRSIMPWLKRNCMPESVTDRPSSAVEYVFLFSKSEKYFFDMEAVKVASTGQRNRRNSDWFFESWQGLYEEDAELLAFLVNTYSYKEAHFATWPPKLVTPMIKAGTSERGCCPACLSPWARIIDSEREPTRPGTGSKVGKRDAAIACGSRPDRPDQPNIIGNRDPQRHVTLTRTLGWEPTCECGGEPIPCTVLDAFNGSGTTGEVATELGRSYIGCELNPEYAELSRVRIESWKTRDVRKAVKPAANQESLF